MTTPGARTLAAGALFAAAGAATLAFSAAYPKGTLRSIGPGFFPSVLGWLLVAGGGAMMALHARLGPGDEETGRLRLWPTVAIPGAIVAFGLLIDRARLIPAVLALVLVAWLALPRLRPIEVLLMAAALAAAAALLFLYGLDLPASFLVPGP